MTSGACLDSLLQLPLPFPIVLPRLIQAGSLAARPEPLPSDLWLRCAQAPVLFTGHTDSMTLCVTFQTQRRISSLAPEWRSRGGQSPEVGGNPGPITFQWGCSENQEREISPVSSGGLITQACGFYKVLVNQEVLFFILGWNREAAGSALATCVGRGGKEGGEGTGCLGLEHGDVRPSSSSWWLPCKWHPILELNQGSDSKGSSALMGGYGNLTQFTAPLNSSFEIASNLGSFIIAFDVNNCEHGRAHPTRPGNYFTMET